MTETTFDTIPQNVGTILTLEMINALMSDSRTRGGYILPIDNFAKSGELGILFSDLPQFAGKTADADINNIRNNVKLNVTKHSAEKGWPNFEVRVVGKKDNKKVMLVNLDLLGAVATQSDDSNTEPSDDNNDEV